MKLLLYNKDGMFDITQLVASADWSGQNKLCARKLAFQMATTSEDPNIPIVKCNLGNAVQLFEGDSLLFEGFVFNRSKSASGNTMSGTCFDRGIYLNKNSVSRMVAGETAESVTAQICGEFNIEVGELAKTGVPISRKFFGNTIYQVIQTLYTLASKQTGKKYRTCFQGAKLCVFERGTIGPVTVIESGVNLINAQITESIEDMVNQVQIFDQNHHLIQTVRDDEANKLYGVMQSYVVQSSNTDPVEEANRMMREHGLSQQITIDNLGDSSMVAGGAVFVKEPYTGVYGLFYIDSDTHSWKNNLYFNILSLELEDVMDQMQAGERLKQTKS